MKLIRFGELGREKPGLLLEDGSRIDCSADFHDWDEGFFGNGGMERLRTWMQGPGKTAPKADPGLRLGSAVARPSKILCVGLNYAEHARESGAEPPKEPVLFMKSSTALCGPYDPLLIPRGSVKTDYEVELGVVIGRKAKHVPQDLALAHIAGYVLHNDYSEREYQLERGGQWMKGKSCDSFAPLGPFLASADEIVDPQHLRLWLNVNGVKKQDSSTADMIFGVATLVSYISHYMTLLPGDVISTGTPQGVGMGRKPQVYLKAGDVIECGIDGLGTARQTAIDDPWKP
ncbi:MAG: fumarylacetoacetate hydrolase family protein [candidate division FCPU426 bacterium]